MVENKLLQGHNMPASLDLVCSRAFGAKGHGAFGRARLGGEEQKPLSPNPRRGKSRAMKKATADKRNLLLRSVKTYKSF